MSIKFNISSNKGNVTTGTIVIGNKNIVSQDTNSHKTIDIEHTKESIRHLADKLSVPHEETSKLLKQVDQFNSDSPEGGTSEASAKNILKIVNDNFPWAYPIIKDCISTVFPALFT